MHLIKCVTFHLHAPEGYLLMQLIKCVTVYLHASEEYLIMHLIKCVPFTFMLLKSIF